MSLADAYRYAAEVMTENMMARDAEEGIGAFIEKREPKWQDESITPRPEERATRRLEGWQRRMCHMVRDARARSSP